MRRVRIDWLDLSEGLGIQYVHPPEQEILSAARRRADVWRAAWESRFGRRMGADERRRLEGKAQSMAICHWSAPNVISRHLDMAGLVDAANRLVRDGLPGAVADGRPCEGAALAGWEEGDRGVSFMVERPFLALAAATAAHCGHVAPAALAGVTPEILVVVLRTVQEREKGPPLVDLRRWDEETPPLPDDLPLVPYRNGELPLGRVSRAEAGIMSVLGEREMRAQAIIEATGMKQGSAYVTLGRMEEKGLLESRQDDGSRDALGRLQPRAPRYYRATAHGLACCRPDGDEGDDS